MAWGSYTNRQRVGTEMSRDRSPTQSNPSVQVTCVIKQQTDYTSFNYDGSVEWWGDMGSGSHTGRLNDNDAYTHATLKKTFTAYYSGTRNVDVAVRGTTKGTSGTSSVDSDYTIPRRPTGNPTAPGTPSVSANSSTSVDVSWGAPSDMKGTSLDYYRVEVSTTSSFSNIIKNPTTSSRSITIGGLPKGDTLYFRIRAACDGWDANRTSAYSGTRTFKMPADPPSTPSTPSVSAITSDAAKVTMSMPSSNGATITNTILALFKTSSGDDAWRTDGEGSTALSHTFAGLDPYTTYYARAAASNAEGTSGWSARRSFRTLAEPPTLTSYAALSTARTSAVIGGFVIGSTGGQSPSQVRVQWNTSASTSGATITSRSTWGNVTIPGLSALTTYYYRAAAYNSGGWGPYGEWKSFTTLDATPNDPVVSSVTGITDTTATVNWAAPVLNGTTIENYVVVLSRLNDPLAPERVMTVDPELLSATFTDLIVGTNYTAFVMAKATPGDSGFGPGFTFHTSGGTSSMSTFVTDDEGNARAVWWWLNVGGTWKHVRMWFNDSGSWKRGA